MLPRDSEAAPTQTMHPSRFSHAHAPSPCSTAGYPAFIAWMLWRSRERIMEDQLLRAKGAGSDRLTNPHAYELRKSFSRVYYQFKPDYVFWSLAILLRKFFIAFVTVMVSRVFNGGTAVGGSPSNV